MLSMTQMLTRLNVAEQLYLKAKETFSKASTGTDRMQASLDVLYHEMNYTYFVYTQTAKEFVKFLSNKPNELMRGFENEQNKQTGS